MSYDPYETQSILNHIQQWKSAGYIRAQSLTKLRTLFPSSSFANLNKYLDHVYKIKSTNPMHKGCSSKVIGKNISDMLMHRHGHKKTYTQKQAMRIALDAARKQGCSIPRANPPKEALSWFNKIYDAGRYYAGLVNESMTPAEANTFYKDSLRDLENASNTIFNKVEKDLFMEGFIHKLMNL